jgi:hypothetical protein
MRGFSRCIAGWPDEYSRVPTTSLSSFWVARFLSLARGISQTLSLHPRAVAASTLPPAHEVTTPSPSYPNPSKRNARPFNFSSVRRSVPNVTPSGDRHRLVPPWMFIQSGLRFASLSFQKISTLSSTRPANRAVPGFISPSAPPPSMRAVLTFSAPKRLIRSASVSFGGNVEHEK